MACLAQAVATAGRPDLSPSVPVILDRGESAAVALIPSLRPLAVGDRFAHEGEEWVVVRAKDHLRGAVAVPARRGKLP